MSCPVCFNAATSDDTVRQSINLGIFVMMGVTGVVLAAFLRFIISIVRRSRLRAESQPPSNLATDAGVRVPV
jgi:hypothetical protein